MGTIIGLFSAEQLDNIASHLLFPDDRVIFLGYRHLISSWRKRSVTRFFQERGCKWEPTFVQVDRTDLTNIIDTIEPYMDCCEGVRFDLSGGEELVLVAMGILSERHGLPMLEVSPRSGRLIPVSGDPGTPLKKPLCTAAQMTMLYGGCILRSEDAAIPTTPALTADVAALWELSRRDKRFFNRTAAFFNSLARFTSALQVQADVPVSKNLQTALRRLERAGFLTGLSVSDRSVRFCYRDETIAHILGKAGLPLELITRIAAEQAKVFSDVRQGVILDWDGVVGAPAAAETRNEADLILMRGMTPIFISCKNGEVKKEALYELDVVASRFGGTYAKKALVCNSLTGSANAVAALRQRAKDMGIVLIEDVYTMTLPQLSEQLRTLGAPRAARIGKNHRSR